MKIAVLVIALLDFAAAWFAPAKWRPQRGMLVLIGLFTLGYGLSLP